MQNATRVARLGRSGYPLDEATSATAARSNLRVAVGPVTVVSVRKAVVAARHDGALVDKLQCGDHDEAPAVATSAGGACGAAGVPRTPGTATAACNWAVDATV